MKQFHADYARPNHKQYQLPAYNLCSLMSVLREIGNDSVIGGTYDFNIRKENVANLIGAIVVSYKDFLNEINTELEMDVDLLHQRKIIRKMVNTLHKLLEKHNLLNSDAKRYRLCR
jgi:hypothetical protein